MYLYPKPDYKDEKRVTVKLQKYWDYIRKDIPFASERSIQPSEMESIWENCFIVKADNSCKKEDYQFKYLGQNIIKAYGEDLTGKTLAKIVATEASHLADKYELVLARKRPVANEGELHISKTAVMKYRQILLPLGDDGVNITAILGGMSYKIVENEKKQPFFLRFRGKK